MGTNTAGWTRADVRRIRSAIAGWWSNACDGSISRANLYAFLRQNLEAITCTQVACKAAASLAASHTPAGRKFLTEARALNDLYQRLFATPRSAWPLGLLAQYDPSLAECAQVAPTPLLSCRTHARDCRCVVCVARTRKIVDEDAREKLA